ncbi:MAG: response regulator [bacterium]
MATSVLVVDDDQAVRSIICDVLKEMDFNPVPASNGVEALEAFRSMGPSHFSSAIVDLLMPEMSGKELVENLRNGKPSLVIILCTGHPYLLLGKAKCSDFGFDALIAKPFMVENFKKKFLGALLGS